MNNIRGKELKKLRRMFAGGDDGLTIGVLAASPIETPDLAHALPESLMVGVTRNGVILKLSPRAARELAAIYERRPKSMGLEWMPTTLREVADEVDALKRRAAN